MVVETRIAVGWTVKTMAKTAWMESGPVLLMAVETRIAVGWTVKTMAKTARMELGPIGQALVRLAAIQSAAMRTATKTDQWMTLNQDVQRATSMVDGKPCQTSPGRCTIQTSLAFACQAGFAQTPSNQTAAASPLRVQKWADLQ